jgi:hypothetical protein
MGSMLLLVLDVVDVRWEFLSFVTTCFGGIWSVSDKMDVVDLF